MVIKRSKYIDVLDKMYSSDKFELTIIYGRRRVGKTELVKEFCSKKPCIYYTTQNNDRNLALEIFSQKVFNQFTKSELIDKNETEYLYLIEHLKRNGIVYGYADNSYRPKGRVMMAELISKIVTTIFDVLPKNTYNTSKQVKNFGWATEYVNFFISNNLITEKECKNIEETISCYEARDIFLRAKSFFEERSFNIKSDFDFLMKDDMLTREELCLGISCFQRNMPKFYFENWNYALEYIANNIKDEKIILVIDEYQYLVDIEPGINSILQNLIDHKFKKTKLKIILLSSSMSIKEKLLSYKMPLYGRETYQLKNFPFKYYELGDYYSNYTSEEKIILYSIFGGMPNIIEKIDLNKSIKENIIEMIFSENYFLFNEVENILKEELNDYNEYLKILYEISIGNRRLNEISTKSGINIENIKNKIDILEELELIYQEKIVYNDKRKNISYRIKDNFINFWFSNIYKNELLLETGKKDYLYSKIIKNLSDYIGNNVFENVCIDYLKRLQEKDLLKDVFVFENIGRCSWNNSEERKEEELDVLAYDGNNNAIFGECKWKNEPINMSVYKTLLDRSKQPLFKEFSNKYYFLFSKSGFTCDLIELAKRNTNIRLVSIDDLFANV